jgi:hypothetical protein
MKNFYFFGCFREGWNIIDIDGVKHWIYQK